MLGYGLQSFESVLENDATAGRGMRWKRHGLAARRQDETSSYDVSMEPADAAGNVQGDSVRSKRCEEWHATLRSERKTKIGLERMGSTNPLGSLISPRPWSSAPLPEV